MGTLTFLVGTAIRRPSLPSLAGRTWRLAKWPVRLVPEGPRVVALHVRPLHRVAGDEALGQDVHRRPDPLALVWLLDKGVQGVQQLLRRVCLKGRVGHPYAGCVMDLDSQRSGFTT